MKRNNLRWICILIIAISISFCACKEINLGDDAKEDVLINSDKKMKQIKKKIIYIILR